MKTKRRIVADIVAIDAEGEPFLLVEVKAEPILSDYVADQLVLYLKAARRFFPFGMAVNRSHIVVFRNNEAREPEPILTLATADMLRGYGRAYDQIQIDSLYLSQLTEIWLKDLAVHWHSNLPPGSTALESIGLLPCLAGGTLRVEVRLGSHPLRHAERLP